MFFQGLSIGVSSVNALAVVGGVTVLGGAGLAFVQDDIKKVLAVLHRVASSATW